MTNKIIAISREFGSAGRTIGKRAAAELGIPCFDMEIIDRIAADGGFNENLGQDQLWNMEKEIILDLVDRQSCVIVGRCADYILRDDPQCIKVFIHASMKKRAERILKAYGDREETPEKRLKEKDKRRIAYYQRYTGNEWGAAQNYDITLNSGVLGIEKCVEILVNLYESK